MLKMDDHLIDAEIDPGVFRDIRLARRLRLLLGQLAHAPGQSLPLVCQDWVNTKAAYRFLSNERVDEAQIRGGRRLDRDLSKNLRVGVGYNFTDFKGDLTRVDDYRNRGWFLNLVGYY